MVYDLVVVVVVVYGKSEVELVEKTLKVNEMKRHGTRNRRGAVWKVE